MPIYRIFDKNICINFSDNRESRILEEELTVYPKADKADQVDLTINLLDNIKIDSDEVLSNNPAIHKSLKDGFIIKMGVANVQYKFEKNALVEVNFSTDKRRSTLLKKVNKWRSMQFTEDGIENIGQIFHELILVPMMFCFEDYSLVHASSVLTQGGKTVLFGGTGGVGKTSLELELCLNHKAKFISDDIVIIDKRGKVHPNLAYPKVYGYNVEGSKNVVDNIFKNKISLNYFHWKLSKYLKGVKNVRRRVSPDKFYGSFEQHSQKLDAFCLLNRSKCDKISIRKADKKQIAELNNLVIQTEYNVFSNHLIWHNYNKLLENNSSIQSYEKVKENTVNSLLLALEKAESYIIDIPFEIPHNTFKKEMITVLSDNKII